MNIVEHLLDLTKAEFGFEAKTTTTSDEIFASQQLFEMLKAFKHSCFNELHTYDSLEFDDEYDDMMDEESSDDSDDFEENHDPDLRNLFTLEEMKSIAEWVDQHPNYTIATISRRFRKIKSMTYINRFREYISRNGSNLEKLNKIKDFMLNEFYIKRAIEKEAVHDIDLQHFAIQKARDLGWHSFKASESFIIRFKNENRIPSKKYNKLITRDTSKRKICTLNGMHQPYSNSLYLSKNNIF
ncbi:unnamed protein product [Rotaria sp. Silwood2]|nr:unnamed protein product [Rotaria sp. Silwood2]CAF4602180.1 unnamed protein product [Rotaria sp. Silwood2]CAF4622540.1 unnamed protein product [Rotaria sp. Silwood2]